MTKLIMTKGLPGSGKTTWARQYQKDNPGTKRVNKDDLRAMVDDGVWSSENERLVVASRDGLVKLFLSQGLTVIVDDTGFNSRHENMLRAVSSRYGAAFEIKDFTNVPLETCIEQDNLRLLSRGRVGREVIEKMHHKYLAKPSIEPQAVEAPVLATAPPYDPSLPDIVLCDIDGTVALMGDRRSPFEWNKVGLDLPNVPIVNLVQVLYLARDTDISNVIFMSGRDASCRTETDGWLRHNQLWSRNLLMRPEGDCRKDSVVKLELYDKYIRGKYNVTLVLDDRNSVVRLWRDLGLTCLQVADGDF